MSRKKVSNKVASIGHSDEYLDRREKLLERQAKRQSDKHKDAMRQLRREMANFF